MVLNIPRIIVRSARFLLFVPFPGISDISETTFGNFHLGILGYYNVNHYL